MQRLILHIGMHKTGTTSIQDVLGDSRDILKKYNVYYPTITPFNHSTSFPPLFLKDPSTFEIFRQLGIVDKEDAIKEQARLREAWIKEFMNFKDSKCENFIISGEEIPLSDEDSVQNMKEFIFQFFDDVIIIMYARHPDSYYPSVLSEYIKHGGDRIVHALYSRAFPLYRTRLEKFIKVFGPEKIIVRPFDKHHFYKGDLFEDFFYSCGLHVKKDKLKMRKSNESLDENVVLFLMEYNKHFPRYKDGLINEERGLPYRLNIFYSIVNRIKHKKFHLEMKYTADDARAINEEIRYINQFLSSNEQFAPVSSSSDDIKLPEPQTIPMNFYTELVNEFSKEIDRLLNELDKFKRVTEWQNQRIQKLEKTKMESTKISKIENTGVEAKLNPQQDHVYKNNVLWKFARFFKKDR